MAIVRNIENNDLYRYLGENMFKNIRTGKEGIISGEQARRVLKINLEATELINEFPIIETMIKQLNLKFDK